MTTVCKLLTGKPAPTLEVQTLTGQPWTLSDQKPQHFTMIVFYRGSHCPLCKAQLGDLEQRLEAFKALGLEVIAISGDTLERSQSSQQDWNLQSLTVGYGLTVEAMRTWGLYISKGAYPNEPDFFNEPAIFFVRPDGTLNTALINSTPFGRPHFEDLLGGIDYILKNNYPIRGTEV